MKLGVVGLGVVGQACFDSFKEIGNEVLGHDIKLDTSINDVMCAEIIYVCVPTPSNIDGSCNTSIVESVISELCDQKYKGVIAIKSTIEPGFTDRMIQKHENNNICFVPEFLRERCAKEDFLNYGTLVVGSENKDIVDLIIKSHADVFSGVKIMSPSEAELVKYFHNTFNAMRVSFANSYYEISQYLNADYEKVLEGVLSRNDYSADYLKVNEDLRGFSGPCLPKDTNAISSFCLKNDLNTQIFKSILDDNERRKKTVFKGMRDE